MEAESHPLYLKIKFEAVESKLPPIKIIEFEEQSSIYYSVVPIIVALYFVWPKFNFNTFYCSDARQTLVQINKEILSAKDVQNP